MSVLSSVVAIKVVRIVMQQWPTCVVYEWRDCYLLFVSGLEIFNHPADTIETILCNSRSMSSGHQGLTDEEMRACIEPLKRDSIQPLTGKYYNVYKGHKTGTFAYEYVDPRSSFIYSFLHLLADTRRAR